mmetsp:Transcript_60055/g.143033  ORF Transcript_60055/g.143033 Transcript_60055/m.143033 type:complete len:291 (-) Transcript_60055:165-1037(-)
MDFLRPLLCHRWLQGFPPSEHQLQAGDIGCINCSQDAGNKPCTRHSMLSHEGRCTVGTPCLAEEECAAECKGNVHLSKGGGGPIERMLLHHLVPLAQGGDSRIRLHFMQCHAVRYLSAARCLRGATCVAIAQKVGGIGTVRKRGQWRGRVVARSPQACELQHTHIAASEIYRNVIDALDQQLQGMIFQNLLISLQLRALVWQVGAEAHYWQPQSHGSTEQAVPVGATPHVDAKHIASLRGQSSAQASQGACKLLRIITKLSVGHLRRRVVVPRNGIDSGHSIRRLLCSIH